jgi:hypothetical protein
MYISNTVNLSIGSQAPIERSKEAHYGHGRSTRRGRNPS